MPEKPRGAKPASAKGRQDADYEPPILAEPKGGPVPGAVADRSAAEAAGRNDLKHYWLRGEGAAKWSTWTELYHHLKKHMAAEMAKRVAAEWFHERYGIWPGADLNRVAHGKPPRGHQVGPG